MFLCVQERSREAEPETWAGATKDKRDGKKTVKLPETPKTAEEMWQHSVIGDYLAKYRVSPAHNTALVLYLAVTSCFNPSLVT